MSIEFAVGRQVVCIDDNWTNDTPGVIRPILNGVYTIRAILTWEKYDLPGMTFLLEEIDNRHITNKVGIEHSFFSWHFRPVKPTSIDTFTKMVKDTPTNSGRVADPPIKETTPVRELETIR